MCRAMSIPRKYMKNNLSFLDDLEALHKQEAKMNTDLQIDCQNLEGMSQHINRTL